MTVVLVTPSECSSTHVLTPNEGVHRVDPRSADTVNTFCCSRAGLAILRDGTP
jgi:hypothetical protein